MRYDTPLGTASATTAGGVPLTSLPVREQLRAGLRDMWTSARSSARNFGAIGGSYAFTECVIEGLRARNDAWNGVAAGAVTGAVLARRGGPTAVALGALGFAVFSGAIDWYMRGPEAERRFPVD
jgi:mitochondrial import inner membrane translocase subunit TIM22